MKSKMGLQLESQQVNFCMVVTLKCDHKCKYSIVLQWE